MPHSRRTAFLFVLLLLLAPVDDARPDASRDAAPPSLTELAAAADLVALGQVRDTDYRRQRDIPVSGSAFLKILIAYKADRHEDLVEVYEKGLHEHECYFPNPTVFEEGRRYLLFLRRDPEDPERYRGLARGCALEVLVTRDNRYALRFPPNGIELNDALDQRAEAMAFADRYALIADEDLAPAERNALRDGGYIERAGDDRWRYTRGVDLSAVRRLIDPDALAD
ncbi:MAG: hypothetical protein P8Y54_05905 [Xanthomonadales bacterium]